MLAPKKVKHRKWHKGRSLGRKVSLRGNTLRYGDFGIKAESSAWINSRQIESARRTVTGYLKREGKVFIRIFPDKPITKKPLEVRQGKGKGNVEYWVCPIKPGKILYEMEGVDEELAKEAFALASAKMPISTTFIRRV